MRGQTKKKKSGKTRKLKGGGKNKNNSIYQTYKKSWPNLEKLEEYLIPQIINYIKSVKPDSFPQSFNSLSLNAIAFKSDARNTS